MVWEVEAGNNPASPTRLFTYTFPERDTIVTYLVRLTVYAESGCTDSSYSEGHFITIYPAPKVKINVPICEGKETYLKPLTLRSEFSTHYWSWIKNNGEEGNFIGDSLLINQPGIYYLKSLSANAMDCFAYDTLIVTSKKQILENLTVTDVDCWGNATGQFRHGRIIGAKEPFLEAIWTIWDNNNKIIKDSNVISRIGGQLTFREQIAGIYTFWGIDANGCEITDTIIIHEPDSLHFSAIPQATTCFEDNGGITFQIIGGVSPYNISITGSVDIPNNKTSDTITMANLPSGMYTATVTDNNNCLTSDTITVNARGDIPLATIALLEKRIAIEINQDTLLTVVFSPTDACNQDVIWHSQDTNVATVDKDGKVKAVFYGETCIVVVSDEGNFQDSCKITIPGLSINSFVTKEKNLSIYPNPANTELHIKLGTQETADFAIYNIVGQLIMQGKLQKSSIINVESLANGMYFLRIFGKENTTVKIIVTKIAKP